MDQPSRNEDPLIQLQEFRMCQPPPRPRPPELRVGKGQPDLAYFILPEIGIDPVDLGPKERGIGDPFLQAFLRADVDAVTLDVDSQEIPVRIHPRQAYRILSLAAGQLERQWLAVAEKCRPSACHVFGILKDIRKSLDGFEAEEFFVAHKMQK